MIGVLRLIFLVLLVQTALFILISGFQRGKARKRAWADYEALTDSRLDWDTYLERKMLDYHRSLRKKLIWSVYVGPMVIVVLLVYFVNFA